MSERILRALMQMFAIIAKVDGADNSERQIVESFLKQQLNLDQVEIYLKIFDEYLESHHNISKRKEGAAKKTSVNSVKVLRICNQINQELEQAQKVIVLIRLFELINSSSGISKQEFDTSVYVYPGGDEVDKSVTYTFEIVGIRPMISVGEWYDYVVYDVTILNASETLKKWMSMAIKIFYEYKTEEPLKQRLEYFLKKDSYILRRVLDDIDNTLGYYHTGDYTRSTMRDVYISDKLVEEIKNTVIEK